MDFVFDYISVNTFWTILLIAHSLFAVTLLGALTHQAVAVLAPVRGAGSGAGFVTRFRAVSGPRYVNAVCLLWAITFLLGAWIYTQFRIYVRIPIEQQGYWKTQGMFELKEHLVTFGLGLLPSYWYLWKNAHDSECDTARKWLTAWLAFTCWYAFLMGHIVNNVRGFGS